MAAFAAGFGALAILQHLAFNTGRFDLGNMVQAVWATAHGDPLEVTNLQGEQISRLGSHVDPLLVLFAPLWWLWPSPSLLLTAQALGVALGALPLYRLARKHLRSDWAGLGFALAYLLYPPVQWLTLDDFHPVAFACPLLLYAFWYLDEDRLAAFAPFAVLAALSKEEIPLVLAAMGVWYALSRRRWVAGGAVAALGTAAAAVSLVLVIPSFNEGPGSRFEARYGHVGGSPLGILETAVTDPGKLLSVAFDERGVEYVAQLFLPLLGLFLAAPLALLPALPELAINLLSSTVTQTSIRFHYTAGLTPALLAASVLGAARIARRRPGLAVPLAALALLGSLAANFRLGAIPVWRAVPGGDTLYRYGGRLTAHDRVTARAIQLVPSDAVVSSSNGIGAHLSARRRILSFPHVEDATWVALDQTRPTLADRLVTVAEAEPYVASLRRDPAWRLVFRQDGVLVFRRAGRGERAGRAAPGAGAAPPRRAAPRARRCC